MLVLLLLALAIQAVVTFGHPIALPNVLIAAFFVCVGVVFSTMTIDVSDNAVEWWFTFGILRQRVSMSEIRFATSTRVTLLNGLGIRTNGKKIWLGSPEAQDLAVLIDGIIGSR